MKPSETVIIPVKVLVEKSNEITRLKEQIELLQEQLKDANRLIKMVSPLFDFGSEKINNELSDFYIYLKKWVVK